MIEFKTTAISTAVVLRIVSPEAATVKPVFFTKRTGGPAQLNAFRVFSIGECFDISLLCALGVHGDSVYKKMPGGLELTAAPAAYVPSEATASLPSFAPFKNCERSSLLNMLRVTYSLGWILPT